MNATKTKTIRINLTKGAYAVRVSYRTDGRRDFACGDGIVNATSTLVTRCDTREEAEEIAELLNDSQPRTGLRDVHEAVKYSRNDYIGKQNIQRGQTRDCDRQCAHTDGDVVTIEIR